MKSLIKDSIKAGMSYNEYILLVKQMVLEHKTTGNEQSPEKIDFTKLNLSRMKRLDKTISLTETESFKRLRSKQIWLVLTEAWCGDAAQTLPYLNKMALSSENVGLKIVLRDENPELMDKFLTNGARAIPKVIIVDEDHNVLALWGARSKAATKLVLDYKAAHGKIDDEFRKNLQIWYNKDKGKSIVEEISAIVDSLKLVEDRTA